jgi:hypothetical protein
MTEHGSNQRISDWWLIGFFASVKLLIHLLTYDNYELHRDAYLYYAQSEHLAWGYIAVPPSIALFGKIATSIFGHTVFALRLFPAIIGALHLLFIGLMIKELQGSKIAIALASMAFILSPAYLHTNTLFQPVSFNHLYWLISAYLFLVLINRENEKTWLWIGLTFGLAFLNKYSIVFLYAAIGLALLISKHRTFMASRYFALAVVISLTVVMPNLIWQYQHNWPVVSHMTELRSTQLVHVQLSNFTIEQLLMNVQGIWLWLGGLIILLLLKKEKPFRFFGWTYIFLLALLILGSGKSYYTLGIYPVLFVFGARFVEQYAAQYIKLATILIVFHIVISWYFSLSFDGIPFLSAEQVSRKGNFRWEDGKSYDIPQDMADMRGWKQIGLSVLEAYQGLNEDEKNRCAIFCNHYGQAGAVMFYGKDAGIPQPIAFNASFIFWSPDSLTSQYVIWVQSGRDNTYNEDSLLPDLFDKVELKAEVDDHYFREDGTRIYFCTNPTDSAQKFYKKEIAAIKKQYRRN